MSSSWGVWFQMVRFALYLRTGESRTEAEEQRSGRAEACETPQTTCKLIALVVAAQLDEWAHNRGRRF